VQLGDLIYTRLTTDATLTARLSTRVYPDHLPQSPTYDAVAYQIVSWVPTDSNTEISEVRIQLDCYASSYDLASSLAALVRKSLRYYRTTDGSGNRILNIYDANLRDAYEDDPTVWRAIVEMMAMVYEV